MLIKNLFQSLYIKYIKEHFEGIQEILYFKRVNILYSFILYIFLY